MHVYAPIEFTAPTMHSLEQFGVECAGTVLGIECETYPS